VPVRDAKSEKAATCGYCKAILVIDPKFPHKKFCNDTHRKLFWKYGSMSVGKVAERMMRDVRKMVSAEIKAELAPLLERIEELEEFAVSAYENMDSVYVSDAIRDRVKANLKRRSDEIIARARALTREAESERTA
jgi:hypothetical protein